MRARLLAILILILLIGGPAWIYWYFISSNTSSLRFVSDENIDFRIRMTGTFDYEYLPLAYKLLTYEYDCFGSCDIGSLPPANYSVEIDAEGYEKQKNTLSISRSEILVKEINFTPLLSINPIVSFRREPDTLEELFISELEKKNQGSTIEYIRSIDDSFFIKIINNDTSQIGRVYSGVFRQIYSFPSANRSFLDPSGNIYYIEGGALDDSISSYQDTIISLSDGYVYNIPRLDGYIYSRIEKNTPEIVTQSGVFLIGNIATSNPRFTDFMDINDQYRIGYIDGNDAEKLALQNYPTKQGVLVLLDRIDGTNRILRTPFSMIGFLRVGDAIGFMDTQKNISTLSNILP